ncbi:MAG: sodium:solute symporter, partial [Fidelibacterota bacterium]
METLDTVVLIAYLAGVTGIALWAGRKQVSAQSYFLGNRNLPWGMVMLSLVATETSVLTFLSVPGVAYISDLGFLQLALGYIVGRWLVARFLLPDYFDQGLESTYEFIRNRWGPGTQKFTSLVFLVTRVLADGVRLFITAIPVSLITGWSYPASIAVIGGVTLIYTLVGGIRSVVWADSLQFVLYLGGALVGFAVLNSGVEGGWQTILETAGREGKLQFLHFGPGSILGEKYHFLTAVAGGMFLSIASHGTDHLMVQRLLASRNVRSGQKALVGSGFMVFLQFALFLVLGAGLWVYYGGADIQSDRVFSTFIVESLPPGVSGLLLAGIFSAAMSTLSSSINSLASSSMTDWIKDVWPRRHTLTVSRALSVFWALVLAGGASLFASQDNPLVEVGLTIASFTYGGLLGFFVLGRLKRDFPPQIVIGGFLASLITMVGVISLTEIAWPWFTFVGLSAMLLVSFAAA